ncbi:MAG: bifunctional UDP-N-acetylmuramoyl-tripeptide:D-alanyl-D-alanine ligase/alanine racemase [Bacteroidetes bacterium]|nr:bifunctional UDP-N-acetylmuramoyl-tripeptide:D-alanyl-D-alanine ligase/alanine racemase [Bacteroidota bacterium]
MYTLKQIAEITGSEIKGKINYPVNSFLTDSRNLVDGKELLFIALKTSKNNGHHYIAELIEKGVTSFLINKNEIDINVFDLSVVSFVISEEPLRALQNLAAHHRSQFNIPVIGITGSNGKTMVKEWLYQLLKNDFSICRSPKSFNSQLGVPLSVLNLNSSHTLGIFEAGISLPGEMDKLAMIIQPTLGVLTSIGSAHDEGFESREQKIGEKLKLLLGSKRNIINGLNENVIPQNIRTTATMVGAGEEADLKFTFNDGLLKIRKGTLEFELQIPFSDEASVQNVSTCIAVLLELEVSVDKIKSRVADLAPIALRLEIKNGIHNSLIINDYYNSDLDSLKIALGFLHQQNRRQHKAVIVSDIEQSGMLDSQLYKIMSEMIAANKIEQLIGIGKKISAFKSFFKSGSLFFESTEDFIRNFKSLDHKFSHSTVLLKGSRSFGFEGIGNLLQQKSHDTVLEIDLGKLAANVDYFRSLMNPNVKIMCMVKAMGYGGGGSELAKTLQHLGVNYLAVAYADEGVELRQSQINLPVMVMSPELDAFEDIINYRLEPEIYSFKSLNDFVLKLDKLGISQPYPVHIKVDTGMHRLGFEQNETDELIKILSNTPQIKVQSIFSHLAASDNPDLDDFTREQVQLFTSFCQKFEKAISYPFLKHICNSGAVKRFPAAHFDMIRLGIGMHGVGVDSEEQIHLQNVGTLKTKISQIKNVKAGETVGYNRNGKAEKDIRIATIPIGYADGFPRILGNGAFGVYVNGMYCKTIGNVCMDMCMVDITNVNCQERDEVIIFKNFDQLLAMARAMNTITYEVLTSVSARVKRVYVQE